jgi:hypothetical protein
VGVDDSACMLKSQDATSVQIINLCKLDAQLRLSFYGQQWKISQMLNNKIIEIVNSTNVGVKVQIITH